MKESFGILPSGEEATLFTISCGGITAAVTDYGANLVRLLVPDRSGVIADVVLGYDDCNGYRVTNGAALGAIVGRNSNRLKGASFELKGLISQLPSISLKSPSAASAGPLGYLIAHGADSFNEYSIISLSSLSFDGHIMVKFDI